MNAQVLGAPPAQQGDLPVEPPGLNEPVEQEEPLLPQVQVAALPHGASTARCRHLCRPPRPPCHSLTLHPIMPALLRRLRGPMALR